ncbi:MAG TPA: beta-propeller domain-containing protein [Polyangiaceae bacterium]|nr:beta-propeller domain-containing protein [Polyangiaceae bacterium]
MSSITATKVLGAFGTGALALGLLGASACGRGAGSGALSVVNKHPAHASLRAFRSEGELSRYLKHLRDSEARRNRDQDGSGPMGYPQPGAAPPAAAAAQAESAAPAQEKSASADSAGGEESVTNTQHAGVDEGGIVKVHGKHLVVLRRGRLFSIEIGNGELTPISAVDAFGPDINPGGTWYDEMLLSDSTVVVIGYSYERGGTEVGLFDINKNGKLSYRSTYHLRSNDYYSSRNYASRLIGDKLIFYSPLYLSLHDDNVFDSFPAMRKWHRGAKSSEFRRIAAAQQVYRPATPLRSPNGLALHTVTVCDLGSRDMGCRATSVMGPAGRVFYVSPSSVYVWVSEYASSAEGGARSHVYRLPLDGSSPSALRVGGAPVDQFSFLEGNDGYLNVLVRSESRGEGMWGSEIAEGEVALMRVPLRSFGSGGDAAPRSAYTRLPKPDGYTFQNRFVGDHLLYGTGSGWGDPETNKRGALYAVRYANGAVNQVPLAHGVDRIEALGAHAVAVGTDGKNLHFTPVRLASRPSAARSYVRANASQGELRSHGFFYKPQSNDSGMLGLPISEPGRPGYEHLFHDSASVLYLRNDALRFTELGTLGARPEAAKDDGCKASCVDWYGNARPLFLQNRVFALLGYEIVEGKFRAGRIRESRRVNFAPTGPQIAR